ncbi:TOBE domain-containing protein [Desulfopila sp. IMCC35008]|uniref:TOBE domain-containing protein n=1 Tax=Desulfopila sp. IMCC35008 TaxID=2653858 RepID=UPI001F0FCC27|nr:TOBE domain-containing protein [Desulfopila sp. IMCC35008]
MKKILESIPSAVLLAKLAKSGGKPDPVISMLEAIATNGSINQAAKVVGISYKAAWERVEAINNLSPKPLVVRKTGGSGGGGTVLTDNGRLFLKRARLFQKQQEKLVTFFEETPRESFEMLQSLRGMEMQISARNVWLGNVSRIEQGAVNSVVTVRLKGEDTIVSVITHNSVERLGLVPGKEVHVLVKAPSVMLSKGADPDSVSARNILRGTINRISQGAVNDEIVVDIAGGNTVTSIVTSESVRRMELEEKMEISAIIKASSVLLAIP